MVLHCVVPECPNSSRTPGISFHCFPSDEKRKKAWFIKLRHRGRVTAATRVCSAHFLPEDYRFISNSKKFLKDTAEPSVFPNDTSRLTPVSVGMVSSSPKAYKVTKYFPLKEKAQTFLPFNIKKNIPDSCIKAESNTFTNNKAESNTLTNIKQSYPVSDAKTLNWLKLTKKTRKTFINYFAAGMTPAVAIQHHEKILRLENPGLVFDGKRNPPKAWVYSLYDSWLRQKEKNLSVESQKDSSDKLNPVSINENVLNKVPIKNEADPVVHQKYSKAPCIILMNNEPPDDNDDLKYLVIPDEVKKLFYKYFDAGLDAFEAKKLNEENLKRSKNWPQFNPSQRVINYIFKHWHEEIKSCDNLSNDSGFASCNEKNPINLSFESFDARMDSQDMTNNVASSTLTSNSDFNESATVISQAEVNSSQKIDMEVLSFPFMPSNESPGLLTYAENNNNIPEIAKDLPLQSEEKLPVKMPVLPKVNYANNSVQNQFLATSFENSDVAQFDSSPIFESFNNKTDFSNNYISVLSVINETKTFNSIKNSSVSFQEEEKQEKLPAEMQLPKVDCTHNTVQNQFVTSSKNSAFAQLDSSPVFESFNLKADYSNNQMSVVSVISETKTFNSIKNSSISFHEGKKQEFPCNLNNFVQNQFIATSSENSGVAQLNSSPVFEPFNVKTDFSNNHIPVVSVTSETKTFNSIKNSSISFHEEKKQELPCNLNNNFLQNQFIATSSEDSGVAQFNSSPVFESLNLKTDFSNDQISVISVTSETKTFNSIKNSSVSFHEEKKPELPFNLNKPCYSDFSYKYPYQVQPESPRFTCHTTFSNSFNEFKVSNYHGSPVMRDTSIFHPITIYGPNVCFEMNSESNRNEHHDFYSFLDKGTESVSRMTNDVKDSNYICTTAEQDSKTNTFLSSSPAFISGYTELKENTYKSKMNNCIESEEASMSMSSINSRNTEITMSFTDEEENIEFGGVGDIGNFKIAPLEFSKQNEDQKFLMSLLPAFECIPDSFKVTLKQDIFDLVHSTKLKANKCQSGKYFLSL